MQLIYSHINDSLYAGLIVVPPTLAGMTSEYLTGSHIWKTRDGRTWQQVTHNGFEDKNVLTFEAFTFSITVSMWQEAGLPIQWGLVWAAQKSSVWSPAHCFQ